MDLPRIPRISSGPKSPAVGEEAPDFELEGTAPGGATATYRLRDHRGHPVVLAFYPGDDTAVCTRQLSDYNEGFERFNALEAQVFGISSQGLESHAAFSAKYGFRFPLLADTTKTVAAAYSTLGPLGFPRRSVFVIDAEGIVRYAHRAIAGLSFRPTDELVAVLEGL